MPAPSLPLPDAVVADLRARLLDWFEGAARDLPWRRTDDPYRIWLSEVMLQQTRVEQAQGYYARFLEAFPTLDALADAPLDDVLVQWEGLGYYSRARNFHRAVREVAGSYAGRVPDRWEPFIALPGVGPYTAAAVLSIAFGRVHGALDGNVIRVLTRLFAVEDDTSRPATRRALQALADALVDPERPGRFNEAMMELGATVCTPRSPLCTSCPLAHACDARAMGAPTAFPKRKRRKPVPHRHVAVGLIADGDGRLLIQQRPEDGMLGGMWEFPGGKCEDGEAPEAACRRELAEELGVDVAVGALAARVDHAYSHFTITLHAFRCRVVEGRPTGAEGQPLRWASAAELERYALPRASRMVLEQLSAPSLF